MMLVFIIMMSVGIISIYADIMIIMISVVIIIVITTRGIGILMMLIIITYAGVISILGVLVQKKGRLLRRFQLLEICVGLSEHEVFKIGKIINSFWTF